MTSARLRAAGGSHPRRERFRTVRLTTAALAVAALCNALMPPPLSAHGVPTPLDFWGAFGRRVARCQRIIGRSAALCGLRAWNARQSCALAALRGLPCDDDAADRAVETARTTAVDAVGAACTEQQAVTLVFLGTFEAESDVVSFCRDVEAAAVSAVFRPLPEDPTAAPPELVRCIDAAAMGTTKLLRSAFDSRQALLNRIALGSFSPMRKGAMLADSTTAIRNAADALQAQLTSSCSADEFTRTYGINPTTFFSMIASRADCLAGKTYAQGGILCPAPQCGNGMLERPQEECDDANLTDGDGCSATCTRE